MQSSPRQQHVTGHTAQEPPTYTTVTRRVSGGAVPHNTQQRTPAQRACALQAEGARLNGGLQRIRQIRGGWTGGQNVRTRPTGRYSDFAWADGHSDTSSNTGELEDRALSEASQSRKDQFCVILLP